MTEPVLAENPGLAREDGLAREVILEGKVWLEYPPSYPPSMANISRSHV